MASAGHWTRNSRRDVCDTPLPSRAFSWVRLTPLLCISPLNSRRRPRGQIVRRPRRISDAPNYICARRIFPPFRREWDATWRLCWCFLIVRFHKWDILNTVCITYDFWCTGVILSVNIFYERIIPLSFFTTQIMNHQKIPYFQGIADLPLDSRILHSWPHKTKKLKINPIAD
jgi:hypothetical protein